MLDPGVPLAAARPRPRPTAGRSTSSSRRSSRRTSSATRRSASGSCTSSGRPTSSTAPSSGSSRESPEDRALRRQVQELDRVALGEATRLFATSANVAGRLERSTGPRRRGAAASAAGARPTATTAPERLRPLGQPARPREADRPADRGGGARARRSGRRRRRRARPRAARGARARPRPRRPRPLRGPRRRRASSPSSTRRCLAVYYAPVDEDFGMGPYEAFLSGKPVITTTDAGGPLDVVHDRSTGRRRRAGRRARSAAAAAWLREHRGRGGGVRARGQGDRRARSPGTARSAQAALVKVALLPPDAARALGDRRLLRAPPAGAARARSTSSVVKRGTKQAAARHRPLPSTTSATTPTRTAGSSRRCGARPGVVVLHDFVLHHLVAGITIGRARRARLPRRDGARGRRRRPAARRTPCSTSGIPPLWENRPEDFPLAGEVLDLATGLIVHSRYVEERARAAGYDGPIWRVPHPAWPGPGRRAGRRSPGDPLDRLLRQRQREQAGAAAARGVRARCGASSPARGCCSSAPTSPRLRPRPAAAAARPRRRRASCARATSTRRGSGR